MKNLLYISLGFAAYLASLFFADQYNKQNNHPTLNEKAGLPDEYFIDAVIQHQRGERSQCISNLEKTIEALWTLEKDVNEEGAAMLEEAVFQLESLHKKLTVDTVPSPYLRTVYTRVLAMLASSEITVAKDQVKSDDRNKARVALKYACLHLRNALLFQNSPHDEDVNRIVREMERLMNSPKINSKDLLRELDQLISNIKLQWT